MPLSCRLVGGSGGKGSGDGTSLNIFTQLNEPDIKDGIWVKKLNTHKKIVVDNRISTEGEWSDIVADCPFSIDEYAQPVLYNNKITVVPEDDSGLWAFDGSSWSRIGNTPPIGNTGILMVLNGVLYFLGGNGTLYDQGIEWSKGFCKWDGTAWTGAISLPFEATTQYCWAVYNNYMYCLMADVSTSKTNLWRSSGSGWTRVASMNYMLEDCSGNGYIYNNKIYWNISYFNTTDYVSHYNVLASCDGSSVTLNAGTTPVTNTGGFIVSSAIYNNDVHSILYTTNVDVIMHYKYNGSSWTYMFQMPGKMWLCPFNTRLYAFVGTQRMYFSKTHEKYDPYTLVLKIDDSHNGPYTTAFVNTSSLITGENNRFVSNFNDVFFIGENGIDTTDPIYYGDGTQWIKFKN